MLLECNHEKRYMSEDYKYTFNKLTGYFERWGKTEDDDPECAPFPEILDIEVSTVCSGIHGIPCSHCYKSNTCKGENMSLVTYKRILDKFSRGLTMVALGIGDIDANHELFKIMSYTRSIGVIPNITVNGARLTDEYITLLTELCGAISVSHYGDNDVCYNTIKSMTDKGHKQINIHKLLCEETYESCYKVIDDVVSDKRLKDLNALVFLVLKPKGKRNRFTKITDHKKYNDLICYAVSKGIRFGFDSCFAPVFMKVVKDNPTLFDYEAMNSLAEGCESTLFSSYINVEGKYFPCSFCEGTVDGVDVLSYNTFQEVWNNSFQEFKNNLIKNKDSLGCRRCQVFDIY